MSKILLISIALVFALVFGTFVTLPKIQSFQTTRVSVEEKEIELSLTEEHISHLNQVKGELDNYQETLVIINSAIPEGPNLPPLISFLENSFSNNGLLLKEIGKISTAPVSTERARTIQEQKEALKQTSLEFEISGPFNSFMDFLSELEKSARLIEVPSVSFESPSEGDIFSFEITVKIYSY